VEHQKSNWQPKAIRLPHNKLNYGIATPGHPTCLGMKQELSAFTLNVTA
jgi:hypothetical protein